MRPGDKGKLVAVGFRQVAIVALDDYALQWVEPGMEFTYVGVAENGLDHIIEVEGRRWFVTAKSAGIA